MTLLLSLVPACSSSSADPDAGATVSNATTVCAKDAADATVSVPDKFPAAFPLPPGTLVTNVDDRGKTGGIVVTGVTSSSFAAVLKSLQTGLPARGFTPKDGEVEPDDAESDWTSSRYEGRWAIRKIPQCDGDVSVNVVARAKR